MRNKLMLRIFIILAVFEFICFAYAAIEPFIFYFTGFGFVWEYNR